MSPIHDCNRLLEACEGKDNPAELVQQAAFDHIPLFPGEDSLATSKHPPDVSSRASMPEIIEELRKEDWYKDQIVEHRSFDKKDPQLGQYTSL